MTRMLIFTTIAMIMSSCIVEDKEAARQKKVAEVAATYNTTEENAQKIISLGKYFPNLNNMVYFRDPNTGACYAYIVQEFNSGTTAWGGPGLTTVNCELAEKALINPAPPPEAPPQASCEQQLKQLIDQQATQAPPILIQQ
ncbi:hypothetical protein A2482_04860 [Candidatus Falkowbacteria bacterium RIFOXYC2_FULL_48_21]|uniref:Lipoprotein n=1 Tax=Candidatus Falkowbacteria bacterium RIFOXYC2_FULL_48_21 TaxID=1798005 RepID=A0A1F5T4Y0_9BACT|nr:MAG: hypothetical protein A2482_04860 [Candidatus Falkowbacteria bacterium RIFOXYC2_FULL_48_21]